MVPGPAESASSGNLWEMQILRPQNYWILNSESKPCSLCLNKPSSGTWSLLKFENHWPRTVSLKTLVHISITWRVLKTPKTQATTQANSVNHWVWIKQYQCQGLKVKQDISRKTAGLPCGSVSKESACNAGDPGSISGLGRSPGEGNGNPVQYSCLENSIDRGAWWATVHGITKTGTRTEWLTHTHTGRQWGVQAEGRFHKGSDAGNGSGYWRENQHCCCSIKFEGKSKGEMSWNSRQGSGHRELWLGRWIESWLQVFFLFFIGKLVWVPSYYLHPFFFLGLAFLAWMKSFLSAEAVYN